MLSKASVFQGLRRVALCALIVTLAIAFLTSAFMSFEQELMRYRAERLLADFHQIKLHQSNWADAQRLMYQWGAWGHYDGQCNAQNCRYQIAIDYPAIQAQIKVFQLLDSFKMGWLYYVLGGRYARMYFAFIVQDGTIWRTDLSAIVEMPVNLFHDEWYGGALMAGAKSRSALHRVATGGWVLGNDEQLAQHPYYKAGRPGGCTGCMASEVTYAEQTPQDEIRRLTSLDLSCITSILGCSHVEDLMPAAREWHLYEEFEDPPPNSQPPPPSDPCAIPVWVLGREATEALSVEVIPSSSHVAQEKPPNRDAPEGNLRIVDFLKGPSPWPPGTVIAGKSIFVDLGSNSSNFRQQLPPGKRYILLTKYEEHPSLQEVDLLPCGFQPDTPQTRIELRKGFSQNDQLRGPEL
jgi:hypothetical protein